MTRVPSGRKRSDRTRQHVSRIRERNGGMQQGAALQNPVARGEDLPIVVRCGDRPEIAAAKRKRQTTKAIELGPGVHDPPWRLAPRGLSTQKLKDALSGVPPSACAASAVRSTDRPAPPTSMERPAQPPRRCFPNHAGGSIRPRRAGGPHWRRADSGRSISKGWASLARAAWRPLRPQTGWYSVGHDARARS